MTKQRTPRETDHSQHVTTALIGLATLSLHTSTLRFSSSDTLHRPATLLIQQLMALCKAQQGALFFAQQTNDEDGVHLQDFAASPPPIVLIASVQMHEEDARTALAAYPLGAAPLQWSMSSPPTLAWRRSLESLLAPLSQREQAASHLQLHATSAFLLFVWPETAERSPEKPFRDRDEAIRLLPLLGDAVDTILLHLLLALQEKALAEDALPAELLATVGHEFRGPLTTISGYASTLLSHEQQLEPGERQDFLRAISEAGAHLGKLIDRFLELAQFESNVVAFHSTSADLAALAHEAITAAKQTGSLPRILPLQISSAHLPVKGAEEPGHMGELTISGDRRWLRTMLDILLENAIVYSPQERLIEVSIESTERSRLSAVLRAPLDPDTHRALILPGAFEEHEALLELQVCDHGIGIDPSQLTQIFQRFYRVDTRLTRESNGLGLGLALCKAIVARHRGMLWVESTLGEGSTFHIVLPREAATTSNVL